MLQGQLLNLAKTGHRSGGMHLLTLVHILHYQVIQYLVCPSPNLYVWPIGGPRQILPIPTPDSSNPGPRCSPPELDLLKSPAGGRNEKSGDPQGGTAYLLTYLLTYVLGSQPPPPGGSEIMGNQDLGVREATPLLE